MLEILPWHVEAAAAEPDVSCPNVRGGPPLGATILVWRGDIGARPGMVPVDERSVGARTRWSTDRAFARYAALRGLDRRGRRDRRLRWPAEPGPTRTTPTASTSSFTTLRLLGREADVARMVPIARHLSQASVELAPLADEAEGELRLKEGRRDEARTLFRIGGEALGRVGGAV